MNDLADIINDLLLRCATFITYGKFLSKPFYFIPLHGFGILKMYIYIYIYIYIYENTFASIPACWHAYVDVYLYVCVCACA